MIILDPGSTHMGKMEYCLEMIDVAYDNGCQIKFQLFKKSKGNIPLPYEWFVDLVEYGEKKGCNVFASVFDEQALNLIEAIGVKTIKFAYSQRDKAITGGFETTYVSGDCMTDYPEGCTSLYCIPEYPVKYLVDFNNLFPRFDGFSDHTLGIEQTKRAIDAGAGIIEKHFMLDRADIDCPDSNFAIKPKEVERLANYDFPQTS